MKLVVKIGGSMLFPEKGPDGIYIKKLLPVLKSAKKENQLIVCIGAGKYFKNYAYKVREFLSGKELEWVLIDLLKANVTLFSKLLGMKPIYTLKDLGEKTSGVIGGIVPGRSTDANAAYAAKVINAELLVKITDVNGIYDRDPKKYAHAKLLRKIHFCELGRYAVRGSPGNYGVLDKTAMNYIAGSRIRTVVASGKNPENILKILGGRHIGTEISA